MYVSNFKMSFLLCNLFTSTTLSLKKSFFKKIISNILFTNITYRHTFCSMKNENLMTLLPHTTDNYGGLHFDTTNVVRLSSLTVSQFEQLLIGQINSLRSCSNGSKMIQSVWFRISNKNVHLIEPLIKANKY